MASNFPTSLDTLTNVTDGVDYPKAADINNLNDAVEALQAKVGIDDSAVSTSIDYILKNKIWPIGSVFTAVVSTNPATLLGFGTWSQIAGGKVLVGQTDADADFNVAEETGGAKTATIAQANLPNISTGAGTAHTHTQNAHAHSVTNKGTAVGVSGGSFTSAIVAAGTFNTDNATATNQNESAHTHSLGGSGTALSIMNPYFTVYFWKRVS